MNTIYFLVFYLILLLILIFGYKSQDKKYINYILLFFIFLISLSIIITIVFLARGMSICQLTKMLVCDKKNINQNNVKVI